VAEVAIEVGMEAPDFALKGTDGEPVRLSDFRGRKNVVLVFYPGAFSGVCTRQLTRIGEHEARYAGDDAQVVGVSTDSHHANRAFAESLGLESTILLSDVEPKGEVARRYGVYSGPPYGTSLRVTFVIDKRGVVRAVAVPGSPLEIPDEEASFAALAACAA
jgi:mycoredoxin-dependent peroxiredoxin